VLKRESGDSCRNWALTQEEGATRMAAFLLETEGRKKKLEYASAKKKANGRREGPTVSEIGERRHNGCTKKKVSEIHEGESLGTEGEKEDKKDPGGKIRKTQPSGKQKVLEQREKGKTNRKRG